MFEITSGGKALLTYYETVQQYGHENYMIITGIEGSKVILR